MAEGLTKQYFDDILDLVGVKEHGVLAPREIARYAAAIRSMPEAAFNSFMGDLRDCIRNHYEKNREAMCEGLRGYEGELKAFYYGGLAPLIKRVGPDELSFDWFVRKAAPYFGKIVIQDPLHLTMFFRESQRTESLARTVSLELASFLALRPWVNAGLIEAVPFISSWDEEVFERIAGIADEDRKDDEWASLGGALSFEDLRLKGEDLIQVMERHIKGTFSDRVIEEEGGLRTAAVELLLSGASTAMAEGFLGSAFTDSLPATDMRQRWRLFGLWASKRAGLLVQSAELKMELWERMRREVKAERAWHQLGVEKLGALMKLSPEEVVKIRESSKYSLAAFRRTLARAVKEIESTKLDDEEEIRDAASEVWGEVQMEAEDVERDLKSLKMEAGVEAGFAPLALTLGLFPFSIAQLAASIVGGASTVGIIRYLFRREKREERSGYFLLESKESRQD